MQEIINEPMVALFAPDGSWQGMTLSPDMATCMAIIKMQHKAGLSKSYHELCVVGKYQILPVIVSMKVTGTEEDAFQDMKKGR